MTFSILCTCPPMINRIHVYHKLFNDLNIKITCPNLIQTMTEEELINELPKYNGWIIGDDPATFKVLQAGKKGKLRACVKWGVGTDNVDFDAAKELNIPITNTPNMFGNEVADVAIGYLISLARSLHLIHLKQTINNEWFKPCGNSLTDKSVALIGLGDIGRHILKRLKAFDMKINVFDPSYFETDDKNIYNIYVKKVSYLPLEFFLSKTVEECCKDVDYIIIACSLTPSSYHMINREVIMKAKRGVKIINVSRGAVHSEKDLIDLQLEGHIDSVGLDVFENEPLPEYSELRKNEKNIFGSHNSSNTEEAVDKTSYKAINIIHNFLLEHK